MGDLGEPSSAGLSFLPSGGKGDPTAKSFSPASRNSEHPSATPVPSPAVMPASSLQARLALLFLSQKS